MSGELNNSDFTAQMTAWNAVKKYKSKNKSSNQSDWYMVECRDSQKEIFSYYMWVKYYCKLEAFASPSNGGSVLVNPNSIRETYTYGQGITFTSTATPLSGYRFIEWRDGSASGGQITTNTQCNCTVPANSYDQSNPTKKIIYAIFKQLENKYGRLIVDYVSGSTSDMGSICANNSNTFVSDRKQVDFTITENQNGTWPSNPTGWAIATANSGYNFNGWFSDIGGTNSVTANTSFSGVIACDSSNSSNPTIYRYYAKFSAKPVEYEWYRVAYYLDTGVSNTHYLAKERIRNDDRTIVDVRWSDDNIPIDPPTSPTQGCWTYMKELDASGLCSIQGNNTVVYFSRIKQ